jgi:type IV pilus assembly protein PilM
LLDRLKLILQDPPPTMAFEVSESGISAARIGAKTELEFRPLKAGTVTASPMRENILDADDFSAAVRSLAALLPRKRRDVALILPDYSTRIAVLDFDSFPSDSAEQLSLLRFRLKRAVPFDVESAAISYFAQPAANKRVEVVAAVAPLEIVARYEAPFRAAGMSPGLVTTSSLATLDLLPAGGLTLLAKVAGKTLSVMVLGKTGLRLARCMELTSSSLDEIAAVLIPTMVYTEDNLGGKAEALALCGFGSRADEASRRFEAELGVDVTLVRSPLATPGEANAGLLGYLRSVARDN